MDSPKRAADANAPNAPASNIIAPDKTEGEQLAIEFMVTLKKDKPDATLGMSLGVHSSYLTVKAVKETGLVPAWNAANVNTPQVQVRPGDIIHAANDVSGNADTIIDTIKGAGVFSLFMTRSGPYSDPVAAPPAQFPDVVVEWKAAEAPRVDEPKRFDEKPSALLAALEEAGTANAVDAEVSEKPTGGDPTVADAEAKPTARSCPDAGRWWGRKRSQLRV